MLCLGTIAIAVVTLIGWTEHIDALKTVLPGLTTMKANAAIGVATAALGLLPSSGSWGRAVQHLAMILAGRVVVALAVLTLWEYAFGVRLGLDELFFRDPDTTSMPFPGRMSPATALALLATGAAMILLAAERRGRPVIMAHVLAAVPAAIGYLSLADYAYGVEGLYGFRPFVPIAINTATALVFLAFAILTTHADESWAKEYRRLPLSRGVLSRLLVLSLTVPFVSGLFVVLGAKLGFYKPLFGPVLFACISALATVWLALHAAATVRRAEGEMLSANGALASLNADLEREVAERTREQRLTWQVSPDLLCTLNPDGSFENVNPAWEVALGWSADELRRTAFADLVHPDELQRSLDAFATVQRGEPVLKFENRYRTDAGAYRWLSWVAVPEGGKAYCSARDVTEEKEQASLLAERTADRDRLWAASEDLLVHADYEGGILRTSPSWARVLGYGEADLDATSYIDLVHSDDAALVVETLRELRRTRMPSRYASRVRHVDGDWRTIAWSLVPEVGRERFNAVGRDVTAEREAEASRVALEEQLRQSQKMEAVGQLTGGLAHDFNNLLTGITGSLDLLSTRIAQGRVKDVDRYIVAAQGAAKRAAALTHRLLAFSRRQTLDPKPTDVNRLVAGMEELVRRTIGPAIELEMVAAGGLWATLIDPPQLENALLNLCINARDAMPDGGRLTIETGNSWLDARAAREREVAPGQYVSLCVSDTGTGMPPDVIAKAFDPFFTTKPIGQGTGLGLSMIYGFVRQSGGQVRIYSEPGEGTTVCLYLPRYVGAIEAIEVQPELADIARARAGETVLVVDDEPTVRMLVSEVLEELGYAAIEAADGPSGLRVLQSDVRIDLLVTDVGLPGGMNGRQLADAARVARPRLKVLFITGYAENAVLNHGHLEPGMHVLTKPFAMEALASRIKALITTG